MEQYFRFDYSGGAFYFFSIAHCLSILGIFLFVMTIFLFRENLRLKKWNVYFRWGLSGLLLVSESALTVWYVAVDHWTLSNSLPLHLCSLTLFLSIVMLLRKNYLTFEFVYLAGLAGALQAIFTPDIGIYGYPHFVAVQFFIAHGGIVVAVFFMVFVESYKPQLRSIRNTMIWLNLYAVFIGFINQWTGGNYLFISHKPANPSLMDYLGPWPWYILSLEGVALIMFFLLYLPFGIRMLYQKKRIKPSRTFGG
ncbi:TIGR02206 family membrane protein [Ammoniphilus resinae]|uniref:Integral membrane protein (TIGR02206 family) n=1 Tax=Ammoniphilus resinae TaxID=861532 RepID=A0ABS4GNK9_9BACL|nr:TIGR02206 family membrane protein [Ammoniphilus resinae]MBP1931642.1 putative integral membrane protein (TIGR02206 family) [Ammoniphilus resinae]